MLVYVNGMGGTIGGVLWPALEKKGAIRLSTLPLGGHRAVDLGNTLAWLEGKIEPGDIFLFAAAISSPEICTKNPELARRINVDQTSVIIGNLLDRGVHVIFFSSDTVYGEQC